eukprot:scaffold2438_cov69-Phaeocystis_antarctica.AAC.4
MGPSSRGRAAPQPCRAMLLWRRRSRLGSRSTRRSPPANRAPGRLAVVGYIASPGVVVLPVVHPVGVLPQAIAKQVGRWVEPLEGDREVARPADVVLHDPDMLVRCVQPSGGPHLRKPDDARQIAARREPERGSPITPFNAAHTPQQMVPEDTLRHCLAHLAHRRGASGTDKRSKGRGILLGDCAARRRAVSARLVIPGLVETARRRGWWGAAH